MQQKNKQILYCFSPLVMALTIVIESILALHLLLRHRGSRETQIGIAIIVCLALFQAAEYAICEPIGVAHSVAARIGYASITLLPPLGLHLIVRSTAKHKSSRAWIVAAAYASAFAWIAIILAGKVIASEVCQGNYVIFNLNPTMGGSYFAYYYFWLLATVVLALIDSRSAAPHVKSAVHYFIGGYASFVIPATAIWLIDKEAARGLPSIMCGFAVTFAIILGLKVIPLLHGPKRIVR